MTEGQGQGQPLPGLLADLALGLLPGVLTVYLAFNTGGFFPGPTAFAAVVMLLILLARVVLVPQPFAGVGKAVAVAAGALTLLAVWTLLSATWSHAPARALTEFDRSLLYLAALVLFGSVPRSARRARFMIWGLAAAMAGICVLALITRTMPDVISASTGVQRNRLSYPIGYWNALGLMAAMALVFCLHLTASAREPLAVRAVAVAAMPPVAAALLLTFSRGPLVVGVVGLVAYLVLARPRLAPTALLAAVPTTAVAIIASYRADFSAEFIKGKGYAALSHAGLAEAHRLALTVALCALAAAALRLLGAWMLDGRLTRLRLSGRTRRRMAVGVTVLVAGAVLIGVAVSVQSGWAHRQYERLASDPVTQTGDYRDRLFNPGLNRSDRWRVAIDTFQSSPAHGSGAGTYKLDWERNRPTTSDTTDAHSLYLEILGELGVPGFLLLMVVLLSILGAMAARLRGPDRAAYGGLLAAALVWALHAGIDWDWELPCLTLWIFAAGGLALAGPGTRGLTPEPVSSRMHVGVRIAMAVAIVALAITPVKLALSDRQLSDGLRDFRAGRCSQAIGATRASIATLGSRPEPYQLEGYCQLRRGDPQAGARTLREAVQRDPDNWRYHYGLALAEALAGIDPRPEARLAVYRNPKDPDARAAVKRLASPDPERRRREAALLGFGPSARQR